DGGNRHPVLPGWNVPAGEWGGTWSADGRYYLFNSGADKTQIWAMREKSGAFRPAGPPVQLTAGPVEFWDPAASSDGRKLYVCGRQTRGELMRYQLKTGQWVAYLPGLSAEGLDFSRDGTRLAYATHPEGDLWCSRADGRGRLQLTAAPTRAAMPRWSPDARTIAFAGRRPGEPWQIYLVPADGGRTEALVRMGRDLIDAAWSPDGKSLAIGTLPPRSEIQLVDLQSREARTLIGSQGLCSPRWSPDGGHLLALKDDFTKLAMFNVASQKWTDLVEMKHIGYPKWSADGQHVYFSVWGESVFAVRVRDRVVQRVASLMEIRQVEGSFGAWTGVAPDESPLVLREVGGEDIYALDLDLP
ncbi:MAG TPA: hypothetical protein VNH43_05355, partial [Vicinamibacteria bacterium]|nr:hypothetical protein [Vicinamibacteria bacterium]